MSKLTWFRVGGPAEVFFYPQDEEDLSFFLKSNADKPYATLGAGSNVLVRDGGIHGTVIKLGKSFSTFKVYGCEIEVGAGLLDRVVAEHCYAEGLAGLEFLFTIPGTIGGGLMMNAGCHGAEICNLLKWAWVMDPMGNKHRLTVDELGYSYRHCGLPEGWIFLGGRFALSTGHKEKIGHLMEEGRKARAANQPLHVKTGGSTFANPVSGQKAWKLIDQAGFRGKQLGGAQFSEKHCNFLVNLGSATAKDLEELGEKARYKIKEDTGILLRWEIKRIGCLLG